MRPPIWYDWEYHPAEHSVVVKGDREEQQGFSIAFWRGATDAGLPVSVPCVYADSDVLNRSPRELEELKAHLKENGLNSYYDIGRETYYNSTSGD